MDSVSHAAIHSLARRACIGGRDVLSLAMVSKSRVACSTMVRFSAISLSISTMWGRMSAGLNVVVFCSMASRIGLSKFCKRSLV